VRPLCNHQQQDQQEAVAAAYIQRIQPAVRAWCKAQQQLVMLDNSWGPGCVQLW
jgi:hypothetical protein